MNEKVLRDRVAEAQQSLSGWGSPVGLSLSFALTVASVASLVAAFRRRPRSA
jgi:hypothetical protein